jgi:very-short-patch-repair endonuclease
MRARNIVIGERVNTGKILLAKELRRNMTPEERILWQRVRRNGVGGFHIRRQQIIDGFLADFYCHAAGLVIEVDGPIHRQDPGQDAYRDEVFALRGLRVLRIQKKSCAAICRAC